MKLSEYAKLKGICYRSAWRHFKNGWIPNAYQLQTGTVVIPEEFPKQKQEQVVTYARVSSSENKDNLVNQSKRLIDYCNANGWRVDLEIKEVGSGLNDKRQKLLSLLEKGTPTKLVVEHKDRLARFGVRYIRVLCKHIQCDLIIINNTETEKEDLIQDFVSVITFFCARLYGQRRSRRKTEKLIRELQNENHTKL